MMELSAQAKGSTGAPLDAHDTQAHRHAVLTIGQRLRARRKVLGMTQAEVAEASGIARSHYTRLESGTRTATLGTLEKIGECLGMTYGELFGVDETPPREEDVTRSIEASGELDMDPPKRWVSISLQAATDAPAHRVDAGDVLIFEGEDEPRDGDLVLARTGRTYRVGRYQAEPLPLLHPWSADARTIVLDDQCEVMAVAVRQWRDLRRSDS